MHGFDPSTVQPVGTISEPNLEAVAALAPDLILTNAVRDGDRYEELSAIAAHATEGGIDLWRSQSAIQPA